MFMNTDPTQDDDDIGPEEFYDRPEVGVDFGKYSDSTVGFIVNHDPQYAEWLLTEARAVPDFVRDELHYLLRPGEPLPDWGEAPHPPGK